MEQSAQSSNLQPLNLRLLSKTKASTYLGIGKKKLDILTNEGKVKFIEINGKKTYPIQALQEFIDSNLKLVTVLSNEQTKSLKRFNSNISSKTNQTDLINYNSIIKRILTEKINGHNYN